MQTPARQAACHPIAQIDPCQDAQSQAIYWLRGVVIASLGTLADVRPSKRHNISQFNDGRWRLEKKLTNIKLGSSYADRDPRVAICKGILHFHSGVYRRCCVSWLQDYSRGHEPGCAGQGTGEDPSALGNIVIPNYMPADHVVGSIYESCSHSFLELLRTHPFLSSLSTLSSRTL